LSVNIGEDRTDLSGDVLSEFGPEMAALIADVAIHPAPGTELARLKGDQQRQLSIAKISRSKWRRRNSGAPLRRSPLRPPLSEREMLKGFTIEQVHAFYDANSERARAPLARPVFDAKAMEAAIRKAFSGWKRGSAPSVNLPKPRNERRLETVDRPGAVQSTIYLGMPVTDPSSRDWVALAVMNSLLGGSFGSRITSNIREQKGYTYSPNSQLSTRYRDGYWVETADVTTKDTGASLKEILARSALQTEASEEELKRSELPRGQFPRELLAAGSSATPFVDLHGLSAEYLNTYVPRYAVTPERSADGACISPTRRSSSSATESHRRQITPKNLLIDSLSPGRDGSEGLRLTGLVFLSSAAAEPKLRAPHRRRRAFAAHGLPEIVACDIGTRSALRIRRRPSPGASGSFISTRLTRASRRR
jgi:hypothetical protein